MCKEEIKELLIDTISIADVLDHYGLLPSRGKRIPCPIHGGKNNNFSFSDKWFNCFTCGEKGDIFSLVMLLENVSFRESVNLLVDWFDVPVKSNGLNSKGKSNLSHKELCEKYINGFVRAHKEACIKSAEVEIEALDKRYSKITDVMKSIMLGKDFGELSLKEQTQYIDLETEADTVINIQGYYEKEKQKFERIRVFLLNVKNPSREEEIALFFAKQGFIYSCPYGQEILEELGMYNSVVD